MTGKIFHGSLTRITDFDRTGFDCQSLPREQWEAGDYVVGQVAITRGGLSAIELRSGRLIQAIEGDSVLGALGVRHATLEIVGSWKEVAADGHMHLLTAAGLLGRATSVSRMIGVPMRVDYQGHAMRNGTKLRMKDFAKAPSKTHDYDVPTILVIGTSMSAGKTTSAKIIVRQLKRAGHRVVGAKLTGAGRYRDILAMRDAGADDIFDFVDVGLPSSVLDPEDFRPRLRDLLGLIVEAKPDLVVAEAGASPLEPYNGDTALEQIQDSVAMTVLCASDPYAVVGIMRGYQMMRPDLVAGLATSTSAGVEVIEKLSGAKALNMLNPASIPELRRLLANAVG
ncbi:MAG: ATP-binding protein [Myxococcales bacterium]|nr:ATP-binding protein [Myxococcales bacterium]MDH3483550.1 ATP-binding protein [Myxococcales bacterium]